MAAKIENYDHLLKQIRLEYKEKYGDKKARVKSTSISDHITNFFKPAQLDAICRLAKATSEFVANIFIVIGNDHRVAKDFESIFGATRSVIGIFGSPEVIKNFINLLKNCS